jgi:hypothetical protein
MKNTKIAEERLQFEIVSWFRNTYCLNYHSPKFLIFSVPNDSANPVEQARKKSTGLMAGVSDLIVLLPGRCLFVEVKTETGVQSDRQKDFERDVQALGFTYHLVRSLEDFKNLLYNILLVSTN